MAGGYDLRSGHMGLVVDKVALVQVFSKYFGFHYQFLFHQLLCAHHLSSEVGTICKLMADNVQSGLKLHPTPRN
jgi:hypothetical protein